MSSKQSQEMVTDQIADSGPPPLIGLVMGSRSDWETMRHAADVLEKFQAPHERRVVSAHRTPEWLRDYAQSAEKRGLRVLIAGAGGAAHLPGMLASQTLLPVLGVPVMGRALQGLDSLLSIVQMPAGVPVGTLAIGDAGAKNAAYLAIRLLAQTMPALRAELQAFHEKLTHEIIQDSYL
ncbi:5-(carboxyamino)imidazole ribonucleotide mutase [Lignipirellula cremea]|nr:5-(carboxyamino)imidazole ribonucleotide mutase [Lignipirellula cremea]